MESNFTQENQPSPGFIRPEDKLKNALSSITDARIKENRAEEKIARQEANAVYMEITGENLLEKAKELALAEVESEGFRIVPKRIISPQQTLEEEAEKFKIDQQPFGLQRGWQLLSEAEKKSYENDYNMFVAGTEQARQKLEKKGIPVSREVFYNMVGSGYMFSDLRKSFLGGKIKLPILVGEGVYKFNSMSEKQFLNLVNLLQNFVDLIARKATSDQLNKRAAYKKKRWHERKMRKIRELLLAKINEIETGKRIEQTIKIKVQEQIEIEHKKEEEKHPEIKESEAISKFKALEHQEKQAEKELGKELHKMEKRLQRDVKETQKSAQQIGTLEKKQKKVARIEEKKVLYKKVANRKKANIAEEEVKEESVLDAENPPIEENKKIEE